jgi:hypothetical protein
MFDKLGLLANKGNAMEAGPIGLAISKEAGQRATAKPADSRQHNHDDGYER